MQKILVVDDDVQIVKLIEACLLPLGHTVVTASDGSVALTKAQSSPPNLIIADILMPQMDGPTFISRLWESLRKRDIPIIFLTGLISKTEEKTQNQLFENQFFLAKPFEPARLRELVSRALRS